MASNQRADPKNPNNPAKKAATDNRADQRVSTTRRPRDRNDLSQYRINRFESFFRAYIGRIGMLFALPHPASVSEPPEQDLHPFIQNL